MSSSWRASVAGEPPAVAGLGVRVRSIGSKGEVTVKARGCRGDYRMQGVTKRHSKGRHPVPIGKLVDDVTLAEDGRWRGYRLSRDSGFQSPELCCKGGMKGSVQMVSFWGASLLSGKCRK